MSQQSLLSNFLGGRDSSEVITAGGAENTKVVGVPLAWALVSRLVWVRVVRVRTSSFRELVRAHLTVRRNFLVTGLHSCLNTLGVASPDAAVLAVRGAELSSGVEFRLTFF